ncbi:hypothetical protein Aperf_G00000018566 [Anoplocephala perfoliata]
MNEVIPGLWLGSRPEVSNIPRLHFSKIGAILTVDLKPLPAETFSSFKLMYIAANDTPYENLLKSFEKAIKFIDENLEPGILVHCLAGMSRSATIVIAYLMWKTKIPYDKALQQVLKSRYVSPNDGFKKQLKCFEDMGYVYDPTSEAYKDFASQNAYFGMLSVVRQPLQSAYYTCRVCRNPVFHSDQIISHSRPKKEEDPKEVPCDDGELFTEHLDWMDGVTYEILGKLYCKQCRTKLGSYNWCGEPCTCGRWVTPAFHFSRKHLDMLKTQPTILLPVRSSETSSQPPPETSPTTEQAVAVESPTESTA